MTAIEKSKQCTVCDEVKNVNEFHNHKQQKDGLTCECKQCCCLRGEKYKRTKPGLITKIFASQRFKSKRRNHPMPTYTKTQLKEWLYSQKVFHELYDNWKSSGYETSLVPSPDRLNDYLPYTLDNLQLITWKENNDKARSDRKNGINNKLSKAVIGIHKTTGKRIEFYSQSEAERQTGINKSDISKCCLGKKNSAGGYKWKNK